MKYLIIVKQYHEADFEFDNSILCKGKKIIKKTS